MEKRRGEEEGPAATVIDAAPQKRIGTACGRYYDSLERTKSLELRRF